MANRGNDIVALADKGLYPVDIANKLGCSVPLVYKTLRRLRPDREPLPRRRASAVPAKVLALRDKGVAPPDIAFRIGVSRAYVYKILAESRA